MIFTLKGANRIYKINNTIYVMWIVYNAEKVKIYEISLSKLTLNLRTVGVEDIPELKEDIKEFIETVFY